MVRGRLDGKASTATGYAWLVWEKDEVTAPRLMWVPPCRKALERAEIPARVGRDREVGQASDERLATGLGVGARRNSPAVDHRAHRAEHRKAVLERERLHSAGLPPRPRGVLTDRGAKGVKEQREGLVEGTPHLSGAAQRLVEQQLRLATLGVD